MTQEKLKETAAEEAVKYVEDGQIVGLGTGSTIRFVMANLARRIREGLTIRGVATSFETARLAKDAGIPLLGEDEVWAIDLPIRILKCVFERVGMVKEHRTNRPVLQVLGTG